MWQIFVEALVAAASGGQSNIKDEASKEAAEMIARAKAKAKVTEGPGVSVLHEVSLEHISSSFNSQTDHGNASK